MTETNETMERSKLFIRGDRKDAVDMKNGVHHLVLGYDDHILMAKAWFAKGAVGPSNAMHGAVCLEDGLLIDVFSPAREDFINGEAYKS